MRIMPPLMWISWRIYQWIIMVSWAFQMTYLKKRNDDIFRVIGLGSAHSIASGLQYEVNYTRSEIDHGGNPVVDGHLTYVRIFIKNITI